MSILAECPVCRKKQSVKNKKCSCGENLDKAKKSKRVRYWVDYYFSDGTRKREPSGYSITAAQAADGKKKALKKENKLLDIKPESKMTFSELTGWYLKLESVKALASYSIIQVYLKKFNAEFGQMIVSKIRPEHLENLQEKRRKEGCADATIDQEIGKARAVINKAFKNKIVGGDTVQVFREVKRLLRKKNANARDRILSKGEFETLFEKLPVHTKGILATGFLTGMRRGEVLSLTWDKVDLKGRMICLDAEDTKDREARRIPICDRLCAILSAIPKAVHDNHVFLYRGKPVRDIRDGLKRACRDAGIAYGRAVKGGFVFHDTRHSFNTFMRKSGVPESVIMKITGHTTREMFDRYNTIDEGDIQGAVRQLQLFFANSDQNSDQTPLESKKG